MSDRWVVPGESHLLGRPAGLRPAGFQTAARSWWMASQYAGAGPPRSRCWCAGLLRVAMQL